MHEVSNLTPKMKASLKAAEELLELHDLLVKIRDDHLNRGVSDEERILAALESFDIVKERKKATSSAAKRKKQETKLHWKTIQKRKREARRRHYVSEKNKRKYEWKQIFEQAKASGDEAGAWYKWLGRESTRMAHKKRKGWKITEEEFREHIFPSLLDGEGKPRIPVMQRYDKDGLWELPNMYVTVEGRVVFDGKEYELKKLGYCL